MAYKENLQNYQNDEISLFSLISTLKRERNLISLITLISTIFVMTYAYRIKPIWLGQFNIVVQDNNKQITNPLESIGIGSNIDEKKTQLLILRSPSVLLPVYEKTKLYYEKNDINTDNFSYKSWVNNKLIIKYEEGSEVLSVSYKDTDKKHILGTLNMISRQYKNYSKKSRKENLIRTIKYLNEQKKIMKSKSLISQKEFNKFSIENGLGTIDGFVGLGKETDTFTFNSNTTFDPKRILNNRTSSNPLINKIDYSYQTDQFLNENDFEYENKSDAGIRYREQFMNLEKLESDYVILSSKLKPESNTLKELKIRISTLRNSLKKPSEILIKYKILSKEAERDEKLLARIENKLELYNLEKVNIPNPWEMISKPTIDLIIYPNKKLFLLSSIILSFVFGSIIAFIKENKRNLIYEKEDFEKLINCDYIETLKEGEMELNNQLILNHINLKEKKSSKNKVAGIIYFKKANLLDLNQLKNENFDISDSFEDFAINKYDYISLIIEEGSLKYHDIEKINKYLYLNQEKIVGWFFVNSKTK